MDEIVQRGRHHGHVLLALGGALSSIGNRPTICSRLHLQRTQRRRRPTSPRRILHIRSRRNLQSRSRFCNLHRSRRRNLYILHILYSHHRRNRGHTRSHHRRLWRVELRA
jgi:hypothetical protein